MDALNRAPANSRWRHRKGGLYTVLHHGFIEADETPCIVYRPDGADAVWVRPTAEFLDGRFTRLEDEG